MSKLEHSQHRMREDRTALPAGRDSSAQARPATRRAARPRYRHTGHTGHASHACHAASAAIVFVGAATLALGGCASNSGGLLGMGGSAETAGASTASGYGVVESIDLVPRNEAGVNVGTIAGAVVGGLLGNQVGSGRGRTAATVLGAAGGAYAGQKIEEGRRAADQVYRIRIRADDGRLITVAQESSLNLKVGQRVRVVNGTAQPY